VLVVATRGEHGRGREGFLAKESALWQRRVAEDAGWARTPGRATSGVPRSGDSGMMGTPRNEHRLFWTASVDEQQMNCCDTDRRERRRLTARRQRRRLRPPDHHTSTGFGMRAHPNWVGTHAGTRGTMNQRHIAARRARWPKTGDIEMPGPGANGRNSASRNR